MAESGSRGVSKRKIACDFYIKTFFPERFVDLEVSDGVFPFNSKMKFNQQNKWNINIYDLRIGHALFLSPIALLYTAFRPRSIGDTLRA